MPFPLPSARRPWLLWSAYALAAALPAALILSGRLGRDGGPAPPEVRVPADWTTADLLRRLEPLGLRVVPANRTGALEDGVFLTTTELDWGELSWLQKAPTGGAGAAGAERSSSGRSGPAPTPSRWRVASAPRSTPAASTSTATPNCWTASRPS